MMEKHMKRSERDDLLQVCRMRAKVAKAHAAVVAATRKAEFEAQLATIYSYDDDAVWKQAYAAAETVCAKAKDEIARRAKELGIPREFAPGLDLRWYGRGQNAVKERRAELTRVAYRKIDQMEKEAKLKIDQVAVEVQTQLVSDSLESSQAKAFLEAMPTAEQLMPAVSVDEIQKQLRGKTDYDLEAIQ